MFDGIVLRYRKVALTQGADRVAGDGCLGFSGSHDGGGRASVVVNRALLAANHCSGCGVVAVGTEVARGRMQEGSIAVEMRGGLTYRWLEFRVDSGCLDVDIEDGTVGCDSRWRYATESRKRANARAA